MGSEDNLTWIGEWGLYKNGGGGGVAKIFLLMSYILQKILKGPKLHVGLGVCEIWRYVGHFSNFHL